ncbi:serine--tRNA ligase, mitochondrial-like [Ptychodera flava]|uniref:serine--tRNA ligase, mitochondrial-like n=1 Tax=Ptychodera flava TaxID=63121 RepID=UPI00396A5F98
MILRMAKSLTMMKTCSSRCLLKHFGSLPCKLKPRQFPSRSAIGPWMLSSRHLSGNEPAKNERSGGFRMSLDVDYIQQHVLELRKYNRKGDGNLQEVETLLRRFNSASNSEKERLALELSNAALLLPNKMNPAVPIGDESQANVVGYIGEKRDFDFEPKDHVAIGEDVGIMRVRNLGHFTGHRSYYLIGEGAELEQALIRYTLDRLLKKGFRCISVPDIVNSFVFEGCGMQTSGVRTQVYHLDPRRHVDLCLAGTSEVSVAGYYMNQTLQAKDLPQRLTAISRCYRAETAHTAEAKGIYRVHQFTKVEMFAVASDEEQSDQLHHDFLAIEKELFSELGLHFRILDMPSEELGAPAYRKYDIEAWMPGRSTYGEISSTSNCTDYQSRRLNIKYLDDSSRTHFIHTVNGTACAVPRMIIAILETYQQEDGSVAIPDALQAYMKGRKVICKTGRKPMHFCRF